MISDHACKTQAFILGIDTCAGKGDFKLSMGAIGIESFEELLQGDVDGQCTEVSDGSSALCDPNLEKNLLVTHMELIQTLEKKFHDNPEHVCCSCIRNVLLQRSS